MASDYPAAFAALREILKRHGRGLIVHADTPTDFTLITPAIGPNKKPIWFGAVLLKKTLSRITCYRSTTIRCCKRPFRPSFCRPNRARPASTFSGPTPSYSPSSMRSRSAGGSILSATAC